MEIIMIGAGNVATHLACALHKKGHSIKQVFSRTTQSAQLLAEKIGCSYTSHIEEILPEATIYFYAIKDSELESIISKTKNFKGIHAHTAGSVDINIFKGNTLRYGVFYPLQTFSKNKQVNFNEIPLFIEGSDNNTFNTLETIAKELSIHTYKADSAQRAHLHLSAVFACNFTNYLYTVAADILEEANLPFEILQALIKETADKILYLPPHLAQTGPATRYDKNIINKQIEMLKDKPQIQKIYDDISSLIYQRTQPKK